MGLMGLQKTLLMPLAERVFNLKEKVFLVRTDASLPLGHGSVMVSDAA